MVVIVEVLRKLGCVFFFWVFVWLVGFRFNIGVKGVFMESIYWS